MKKTILIIAALLSGLIIVEAEAAPTFQAAGAAVTGTGVVSPAWPAHAINDVALLFIESTGGQAATLSTPAGFAAVANSPQSTGLTTNGTRITVYWARATSTTMPAPTVADPGDHVYAQIITYRGVIATGNPWDVTGGGVKAAASFSVTVTGVTTTVPNTLIVQSVSRDNDRAGAHFSAETNASLTGIAERSDAGTTSGNGGGFAVWDGVKATAGATGNTTATISRSTVNAFLTIALMPAAPHHIRIEHNGGACSGAGAPAQITLKACANLACTAPHYTGSDVTGITLSPTGGAYTLTPANPQTIAAVSGGINSGITLARNTAGTATLAITGTPTPAPSFAYECYNANTGTSGDCNLVFSANSFTLPVPDHTSDSRQVVALTSCKGAFASTTRSIKFWSTYVNPATGTQQGKVVAGTGNADCATGYSALGTSSASPTTLNLVFGTGTTPQATFSLCYPDAGQVQVDTRYDGSAGTGDPGVVILGNDRFIAVPHHFTLSNINCISGCSVVANPGAPSAAGAAFMKAGNPFSLTVTAYNTNGAVTPNFGNETTPEGVALTGTNIVDPDLTTPGTLTGVFGAFSNGVAIADGVTFLPDGITRSTPFSWDEVGIMTLTAKLASASYLGSAGLKEITTPATGNIGRFIPDHFAVTTDPSICTPPSICSNIVNRVAFPPQTMTIASAAAAVGATTINVTATTGFNVGDTVRIPGAGPATCVPPLYASPCTLLATLTAVNTGALTITLNTGIGTALLGDGTEEVIDEWGSYMGEHMNAQFTLNAVEKLGAITNNYQGAYAKLNPAAAGNPLMFGAVDSPAGPTTTYNLLLDTSVPATGSFSIAGSTGSATITAPLAVTRGASAVGPYNAVQVGIDPTDSDGVKMGAYDLNVGGGGSDHTSIMDPTVQDVTAVRYGRINIANAYGSELLSLPVALTAQYWNATSYVTNTNDSNTVLASTNIGLTNYLRKAGDTWTTTVALPVITAAGGIWSATLSKPTATFSGKGSVDMSIPALIGPSCSSVTPIPVGCFLPSNTARATFGVYKGASEFIYLRENY